MTKLVVMLERPISRPPLFQLAAVPVLRRESLLPMHAVR